ncbi:MAG TPA: TlpA disulfide reductase family protein [Chitinophagaceae bacterium]|nr:TlpA disulfide reductase family protein [Chitinophagaceae bacterium]
MHPDNISIHYDNGLNTIFIPDTLTQQGITLVQKYYSYVPSVSVQYNNGNKTLSENFFLDKDTAKVSLFLSKGRLVTNNTMNVHPIFDSSNKVYNTIFNTRERLNSAQELEKMQQKYKGQVFQVDSLKQRFLDLYKAVIKSDLSILRDNSNSYFSLWYFRNQTLPSLSALYREDTVFWKQMKQFYVKVFSKKYGESIEGKSIINTINSYLFSVKDLETRQAPLFSLKDIKGIPIRLKDYRGKYVLLDFWATWCGPCMQKIPLLKSIRKKYPKEKLVILGISWDTNLSRIEEIIRKKKMQWRQVLDRSKKISRNYSIHAIPQMVLVNTKGEIVFVSSNDMGRGIIDILENKL